jgi:hypothetical protein
MAGLVKWHDADVGDAKCIRFRSAVCGRSFREQLRRIARNDQRTVLVRPAKEKVLAVFRVEWHWQSCLRDQLRKSWIIAQIIPARIEFQIAGV